MRLGISLTVLMVAVGCSEQAAPPDARSGGEVTVTLAPAPNETPAEKAAPEAGFDAIPAAPVVATPAPAPARVAPASPEPAASPPAEVEVTVAPAGDAPIAVEPGTGETTAVPATAEVPAPTARPAGASAWAGYLRKAGFPCRRVASASRVERAAGPGLQYYRVDCEGGGAYQATDKRGHLYFRRWRG